MNSLLVERLYSFITVHDRIPYSWMSWYPARIWDGSKPQQTLPTPSVCIFLKSLPFYKFQSFIKPLLSAEASISSDGLNSIIVIGWSWNRAVP